MDFSAKRKADYGGVILFRIGRTPRDTVMFLADKASFGDRLTDAVIEHACRHGKSTVLQIQVKCGEVPDAWYNAQDVKDNVVAVATAAITGNGYAVNLWHHAAAVIKNFIELEKMGRNTGGTFFKKGC